MEWVYGIQRAIDYVEAHLNDKIDYEMVAKQAYSSVFHFGRVFGILCGYTLGDYIRMRRLTLAAEELVRTDRRILDIALDAGYDTPESFCRAFSKFHGYTPSEVRAGKPMVSFTRLSVKLVLEGGNFMNYRIEKRDAFRVVCKRKLVKKPESVTAAEDISAFWDQCAADGSMQKIMRYMPQNNTLGGLLGVCFSESLDGNTFPYGIGFEYEGQPVEEGLEVVEIPAHTYAVFTCRGKMPDAFAETYKRIVTEFFPQNEQYVCDCSVELEVYPSDNVDDEDYMCEVWIAVNEK